MNAAHGVRVLVRDPMRGWEAEGEDDTPAPLAPEAIVLPVHQPAADREAFLRYIHDQWGQFILARLRQERGITDESRKDLMQRVLLVVDRCLQHQPAPEHPAAWLGEIIRFEAQNHRRRWKPAVEPDTDMDAVVASALSPESAALLAEQKGQLDRYLGRLTPEEVEVVKLKELAGMTFEAVAEALGRPRATVAYQHGRAMEKLQEMALASERGVERG